LASPTVPDIVVARLPFYLRALITMGSEGRTVTSSKELAARLGVSSAQIRKDLSQFGGYGKQGSGYDIAYLSGQLRRILQVETPWDVVIVGMGNLGRALASHGGFDNRGFRVVAGFDNDPAVIGTRAGGFVVQDAAIMEDEIRRRRLKIAMLTVPAAAAQATTDRLARAGIRAVLCFVPVSITAPEGVKVQHADPVLPLQRMTFYLAGERG
jgi:redox-sensing transcriptional repressor